MHTAGEHVYSYDVAGNVESRTNDLAGIEQHFTYSADFSLPTEITWLRGSETVSNEIEYSPGGQRRVRRRVDSEGDIEEELIYVGDALQITDREDGSIEYAYNLFGNQQLLARVIVDELQPGVLSGRRTELALTDKIGTVVKSVDAADGSVLQPYSPTPFGASEEPAPDFGFTSHRSDTELGLIDMRARLYDPAIGRFLSPDPITGAPFSSESWNAYSYALNNPLNLADPSGLCPVIMRGPYDWVVDCTLRLGQDAQRRAQEEAQQRYREQQGHNANNYYARPPPPIDYYALPPGSGQGGPGDAPDEWTPSPNNEGGQSGDTPPPRRCVAPTDPGPIDPIAAGVIAAGATALAGAVIAGVAATVASGGTTVAIGAIAGAVGGAAVGYFLGGAKGALAGAVGGAVTGGLTALTGGANLAVGAGIAYGATAGLVGTSFSIGTNAIIGGPAPTGGDLVGGIVGGLGGQYLTAPFKALAKPGLTQIPGRPELGKLGEDVGAALGSTIAGASLSGGASVVGSSNVCGY